jgi:hypothetical protein
MLKVSEHGQDPTVRVAVFGEVEFEHQVAYVALAVRSLTTRRLAAVAVLVRPSAINVNTVRSRSDSGASGSR